MASGKLNSTINQQQQSCHVLPLPFHALCNGSAAPRAKQAVGRCKTVWQMQNSGVKADSGGESSTSPLPTKVIASERIKTAVLKPAA